MPEDSDVFVDIDPQTKQPISNESSMGAWMPIQDKEGVLILPIQSSMGPKLMTTPKNTPNLDAMSKEERAAYFEELQKPNPLAARMERAKHLSDLPNDVRENVFARVEAALAKLTAQNS